MFDFKKAAEDLRDMMKDKKKADMISFGGEMTTPKEDSDFVVMPEWYQTLTGVKGIPFGYEVMISGKPDSGKTSATIAAMACAQAQNVYVILVDTEKKTTKSRLTQWGVDPDRIARVQPQYLEEAFDGIDMWITKMKDAEPDCKILIVFDSLGNTPSMKEMELSVEDTMQLGMAAKVNKRGLRRLIPRLKQDNIALLLINQTYDNLGSPGKSNSGGEAANFYSCMTYQTARKAWLEKTEKGAKRRVGAKVVWTLYKNHLIDDAASLMKSAEIDITADGMKITGSAEE